MRSFLPGLRIIKTFIAVALCLFMFYFMGYPKPIYAAIACILTMKESSNATRTIGINRVIGTVIGGLVSIGFLTIMTMFNLAKYEFMIPVIASLSVLCDLIICKGFKLDTYVASMSCVVSVITLLSVGTNQHGAYQYVLVRSAETIVGIIIAYCVNRYLFVSRRLR